jgi:hypothetical protein
MKIARPITAATTITTSTVASHPAAPLVDDVPMGAPGPTPRVGGEVVAVTGAVVGTVGATVVGVVVGVVVGTEDGTVEPVGRVVGTVVGVDEGGGLVGGVIRVGPTTSAGVASPEGRPGVGSNETQPAAAPR